MIDKFNMTLEENIFLAKKEFVNNVYSSARIEGINVTFTETYAILDGTNVPRLSLDEIQCILNLRDAWKFVINEISQSIDNGGIKRRENRYKWCRLYSLYSR